MNPVFVAVAAAAVASPGPGVVMTLTNALRHGRRETAGGIAGLVCGALCVAGLSTAGLGVLLATSVAAFTVVKLLGAAYLVYLGVRLWNAPAVSLATAPDSARAGFWRKVGEALSLQVTNPKAVFFFVGVFPQFIRTDDAFAPQFLTLIATYAVLIVAIHSAYALTARRSRQFLSSERAGRTINRVGGATFVCFGAALATARR